MTGLRERTTLWWKADVELPIVFYKKFNLQNLFRRLQFFSKKAKLN